MYKLVYKDRVLQLVHGFIFTTGNYCDKFNNRRRKLGLPNDICVDRIATTIYSIDVCGKSQMLYDERRYYGISRNSRNPSGNKASVA